MTPEIEALRQIVEGDASNVAAKTRNVQQAERSFESAQARELARLAQEGTAAALAGFDSARAGMMQAMAATALGFKFQDPTKPSRTAQSLTGAYGPFAHLISAMRKADLKLDWPYSVRPDWLPKNANVDEPIHGVADLIRSMQREIEA